MIPLWLSENLLKVSDRIRPLGIEYAFLGGSIVPLLLDDPDLSPIRPTNDVDVGILLVNQAQMAAIEAKLRSAGFAHDVTPGAPMCRWRLDGIIVDIMPNKDAEFMGLSSRWFSDALPSAALKHVTNSSYPKIRSLLQLPASITRSAAWCTIGIVPKKLRGQRLSSTRPEVAFHPRAANPPSGPLPNKSPPEQREGYKLGAGAGFEPATFRL